MRPEEPDMARLWDMLDAARAISHFLQDRTLEDLCSQRMLRNAVERNLEIIGEAARHVSPETQSAYSAIPWNSIVGLRNVVAHEYGEILYEKVWIVCKERLPELIQQLEKTGVELPQEHEG